MVLSCLLFVGVASAAMQGFFKTKCQCNAGVSGEYYMCQSNENGALPFRFSNPSVRQVITGGQRVNVNGVSIDGATGNPADACSQCARYAAASSREMMLNLGQNPTESRTSCFYCVNDGPGATLEMIERVFSPSGSYGLKCIHWGDSDIQEREVETLETAVSSVQVLASHPLMIVAGVLAFVAIVGAIKYWSESKLEVTPLSA